MHSWEVLWASWPLEWAEWTLMRLLTLQSMLRLHLAMYRRVDVIDTSDNLVP